MAALLDGDKPMSLVSSAASSADDAAFPVNIVLKLNVRIDGSSSESVSLLLDSSSVAAAVPSGLVLSRRSA